MGRLSATNQLIIAAVLIVAVSAAVIMLGIVPLFGRASELDTQIETEQANLVTAQALVARRQSAKAQSATHEVELMRIANRIPDSPQLPSLIIELQDVANASGLEFPQFAVGTPGVGPANEDGTPAGYSVLGITVTVRGDWTDIIDYNYRLDRLDRGVRVKSTSLSYLPATEETEELMSASMQLEVYMMAAASSAPQAGEAAPATPSQ